MAGGTIQSDLPAIICDTGRVIALEFKQESNTALVSFAPRQEEKTIWGQSFLRRSGASLIGITDYQACWFPRPDMEEVLAQLSERLRAFERVVLYGFSMGAYAALKYSKRLKADVTLAFAPQYSIAPDDVGTFDRRRPESFFCPDLHADMRIEPTDLHGQIVTFYDPFFVEDAQHVARISATGGIERIVAPFTNHDCFQFALDSKTLQSIIGDATQIGRIDQLKIRRALRQNRRKSFRYLINFSKRLAGRNDAVGAVRFLEDALQEGNRDPLLKLGLSLRLIDCGRFSEAISLLLEVEQLEKPPPGIEAMIEQVRLHLILDAV